MATRPRRPPRWRASAPLDLALVLGLFLGLAVLAPAVPATAVSFTGPKISSVSPAAGPAGTPVTITGSGFTGAMAVRFNGVASAFTVSSSSKISAKVPAMPSAAGLVTVTTPAGTAKSTSRFTVTPAVLLSAATGPPGTAVTVSGTGFGALEGVDVFVDTTDEALAGTSPDGSFGPVTIVVPASAVPGTDWVSAEGRHSGLFAQSAFIVNTNWAQFRDSGKHKGFNPSENVLSTGTVGLIEEDGFFPTGGAVLSSPAVAGGVVYFGSVDGNVYALSAATRAALWNFTTGSAVESSPAVAYGAVYIGSEDGNVYALNAATGTKLWTFTTGAAVVSSPAVANGAVYVGSFDHNVYALNAATGAKLWTFTTGGTVESSPAVANGVVYIGSDDNNVYALNAATGAKLWTFTTRGAVTSSPAVAYGQVYVGSPDGTVDALNAATGAEMWAFTTGSGLHSSPAVADGVVYIGSFDGNAYALSAATGDRLWTFTTGGPVFSSPAVANGVVYAGSDDGNLYEFDLAGGLAAPARPTRTSLHPNYSLRGRERPAR